jgi:uncharacterized protein DUF6265
MLLHSPKRLAALAACTAILAMAAVSRSEPGGTSVSTLAWMAGRWRGDSDSTRLEEHWSVPAGDCMMGMFRAVRSGKVRTYEFMSLEQDAGGVLMRIKRFDPGLVGREERDRAIVFRLTRSSYREAVFEDDAAESPKRLTYRRSGRDSMYVRLERLQGGEHKVMDFRFGRAPE